MKTVVIVAFYRDFHSFAAQDCPRLNQAQNSAVHRALSEVITIIVGPPGTGKTTTICSIASMAVNALGKKVLAVAPSNYAIDHLTVGLAKTKLKVWHGTYNLKAYYTLLFLQGFACGGQRASTEN